MSSIRLNEDEVALKGKPTLARRVSDMFKDGNNSGPPLLFRHASMQKLRHCCQNLNLFPYLLYAFDNSKSHPFTRKVNLYLGLIMRGVLERAIAIYDCQRRSLLSGFSKSPAARVPSHDQGVEEPSTKDKFICKFIRQKPKTCSICLTIAVYVAPLIVMFQLIALLGLVIFGKYTPGFIFLFVALMFLGAISLLIVSDTPKSSRRSSRSPSREKNKSN